MQEALFRSLEDGGRPALNDPELEEALRQSLPALDDPQLHEALRQSLLSIGQGPPPELVETESSRRLQGLLATLRLQRLDVGSTNLGEGGKVLSNQCFYLAIARSWLADAAKGGGPLFRDVALQLKWEIAASVIGARGEAALADLGEQTEAYTDFLACAMSGEGPVEGSTLADLAIVVFASHSGALEAYEGRGYALLPPEQQVANLVPVWHRPGHFEAVVALGDGGKAALTLEQLLKGAGEQGIPVVAVKA